MDAANRLIARATTFGDEHPRHIDFARHFVALVQKINREFSGEARQTLLFNASTTFDRHSKVVENTERMMKALEKLEQQQERLAGELSELTITRPPDATLH